MNLNPSDSLRISRAEGKQAAEVRDRSSAPTVVLKVPAEQAKDIVLALDQIRAQCAGDNWVTLEIPRTMWSQIRAVATALQKEKQA